MSAATPRASAVRRRRKSATPGVSNLNPFGENSRISPPPLADPRPPWCDWGTPRRETPRRSRRCHSKTSNPPCAPPSTGTSEVGGELDLHLIHVDRCPGRDLNPHDSFEPGGFKFPYHYPTGLAECSRSFCFNACSSRDSISWARVRARCPSSVHNSCTEHPSGRPSPRPRRAGPRPRQHMSPGRDPAFEH